MLGLPTQILNQTVGIGAEHRGVSWPPPGDTRGDRAAGYLLGDGQKLLTGLNYAPLPASLDSKAKAQLDKIGT